MEGVAASITVHSAYMWLLSLEFTTRKMTVRCIPSVVPRHVLSKLSYSCHKT